MAKSILDPMDRMLGELFGQRPAAPGALEPLVDVIERDDEILVRAAVPGVKKHELQVSVSGTLLTLRGAPAQREDDKGEYYRAEIPRGAFERTLALPAEVDDSKAKASMADGVLELILPKPQQARRRTIRID
jgi:HSP20 family protein